MKAAQRECLPGMFSEAQQAEPTNPVVAEKARQSAAQRRVVAYLKAHGSATNVELCRPEVGGNRGIGRLWQAVRAKEIAVTKEHVKGGVWKYTRVTVR